MMSDGRSPKKPGENEPKQNNNFERNDPIRPPGSAGSGFRVVGGVGSIVRYKMLER